MKYYKVKNIARQAGMTLIELSVVLLILVGLAGLLIPYVSGFMEKTHDSTSVSTIAELNNTIQRHQVSHMTLPNNLESLYDATSTQVYSKLQTKGYLDILPAAAAAGDATDLANASLSKAGIKKVFNSATSATSDATFQSTAGTEQTVDGTAFNTTGIPLVILKGHDYAFDSYATQSFYGQLSSGLIATNASTPAKNALKNQLMYAFGGNQDSWDTNCTNYVVMGLGSANTLIPSSMQSAPVVFGSNGDEAPKTVYARYLGVFAVPSSAGACTSDAANVTAPTADAAARFVGAAADMPFPALVGLSGAQQWTNNNLAKN